MLANILCIGDVVGKAGRDVLIEKLPGLIQEHQLELVVCNAENAAGGSGITPSIYQKLLETGVDVFTLGDHCFRKGEILPLLDNSDRLIRPVNLAREAAGRGWTVVDSKSGRFRAGVFCAMGQLNMANSNSPWNAADDVLSAMPADAKVRVLDFHAEATSEKIAMGWHLAGRSSIVFGTHTHVPTADASVLDGGTAFICDVGMTGPYDSVLGRRKDRVLKFLTSAMPQRFDMAAGDPRMYALLSTVDSDTGRATQTELLCLHGKPSPDGVTYDRDDGRAQYGRSKKR